MHFHSYKPINIIHSRKNVHYMVCANFIYINSPIKNLFRNKKKMGRLFLIALEGSIYSCRHCDTHLGIADDILSKAFHCRHGKAYLFDKVANITTGDKERRVMLTGMHIVADIFCVGCGSIVGWKYEYAFEKSQKYKEGKFILERYQVIGPDGSEYVFNHEAQLGSDTDDS